MFVPGGDSANISLARQSAFFAATGFTPDLSPGRGMEHRKFSAFGPLRDRQAGGAVICADASRRVRLRHQRHRWPCVFAADQPGPTIIVLRSSENR